MFTYGMDIPLDQIPSLASAAKDKPETGKEAAPELFVYGMDIPLDRLNDQAVD